MNRAQTTILLTTMIASFLCCLLITEAQSDEGKNATDTQSTQEDSNITTDSQSDSENKSTTDTQSNPEDKPTEDERTIDISINGDRNTQNFNCIGNKPLDFNSMKGSLEGRFFLTRHEGETISRSYSLLFEGISSHKFFKHFAPGGNIEVEGDLPIENDPLLHVNGFAEGTLYPIDQEGALIAKAGLGIWVEGQQLRRNLRFAEDFYYGMRTHLDIKWEICSWGLLSVLIEYLPQLRFDRHEFRVYASPELEIKLGEDFSLIFMGEIDFYSETSEITFEPVFDLIKPWEAHWMQFIRYKF